MQSLCPQNGFGASRLGVVLMALLVPASNFAPFVGGGVCGDTVFHADGNCDSCAVLQRPGELSCCCCNRSEDIQAACCCGVEVPTPLSQSPKGPRFASSMHDDWIATGCRFAPENDPSRTGDLAGLTVPHGARRAFAPLCILYCSLQI